MAPKGNQGLHELSSNPGSSTGGSFKRRQLKASRLLGHFAAFFIGEPSPLVAILVQNEMAFYPGSKKLQPRGDGSPFFSTSVT